MGIKGPLPPSPLPRLRVLMIGLYMNSDLATDDKEGEPEPD